MIVENGTAWASHARKGEETVLILIACLKAENKIREITRYVD